MGRVGRLATAGLIGWMAGCLLLAPAGIAQQLRVTREFDFKPQSGDAAVAAQVTEYNRLKAAQDWAGALRVARDLPAKAATLPDTTKADIRVIGLDAVANYAKTLPTDPTAWDSEALGDYRSAIQLAGRDAGRVAQANVTMGLYYSKTGRNGMGASYLQQAIAYYTATGDQFQILRGYNDLAALFGDRGELEVSAAFRDKAIAAAAAYFQIGVSPPAGQVWITYADLLHSSAVAAADRHDLAPIETAWPLLQRISDTYFTYKFDENFVMAPLFAMAGDEQRARAIFADGQRMLASAGGLQGDIKTRFETTAVCSEAMIDWAVQQFDRSASLYGRCVTELGREGEAVRAATHVDYGNALERTGRPDEALAQYEEAIRQAETTRNSYSVADRAAVFNNAVFREPYWGRIRILAERAARAKTPDAFFTALGATERIRARQFGELLLGNGDADIIPSKLEGFAAQLGDDTAAVSYTVMSDRIVVLAFTRAEQSVAIVPIDGVRFATDVVQLHERLADPRSDVAEIDRTLLAVSRTVIAPVARLLAGKRNILVLQDGALNLIPFGLLSVRPDAYAPLLEQGAVRTLPSLRIALQQRQRQEPAAPRAIFALGDPTFQPGPPSTLLSRGEMLAVSRGSRYLQEFPRLPGTRREIDAIMQLFKGERATALLGGQATESAIKKADLRSYGYIHLATHGVLGGELPGLNEPALVLAEERGQDGFLTATEAAGLRMDAEVTILSACNTGSGRVLAGEGVLGMSRAFLLAGSRAVVVSLWSIGDESTAVLMQRLYQNKLAGMATAEALRVAALDIRRSYPHPAYWAPFIVIGG